MKQFLNIIFVAISIIGYGQPHSTVVYDTTKIAIIPFDTSEIWMFKNSKPVDLTERDLNEIDNIFVKCINRYNRKQEKKYIEFKKNNPNSSNVVKTDFVIDISRYQRQYIAVTNSKGQKEIWINCICTPIVFHGKREIIRVVGEGGNCYFNLKINLTTGKYYEFIVNPNT